MAPSKRTLDFGSGAFQKTMEDGNIIGWVLTENLFFEDYELPDYEGDDSQLDEVTVVSVDADRCCMSIRATVTLELSPEVKAETEAQAAALFNAVSAGVQLFYWTGEGDNSHPEEASGLYEVSGEMNFCQVNGRVIHERRR